MRQIFQDLKTGEVSLEEIPVPVVKKNHVLIKRQKMPKMPNLPYLTIVYHLLKIV